VLGAPFLPPLTKVPEAQGQIPTSPGKRFAVGRHCQLKPLQAVVRLPAGGDALFFPRGGRLRAADGPIAASREYSAAVRCDCQRPNFAAVCLSSKALPP